jgi:hypothetical protein
MPEEKYKDALRRALKVHEIGDKSPYQLFFARKANSGGSFGFMQGDLAAKQPIVQSTFHECLARAGIPEATIRDWTSLLSVHVEKNPLNDAQTEQVAKALKAHSDLVDAMDLTILSDVFSGLDKCIAAAAKAGRTISPHAQLYIAMWINMSGAPSKILDWLAGGDAGLPRPVAPPGKEIDVDAIESYLKATKYYIANERNFPHMRESAAAGAALLPKVT